MIPAVLCRGLQHVGCMLFKIQVPRRTNSAQMMERAARGGAQLPAA